MHTISMKDISSPPPPSKRVMCGFVNTLYMCLLIWPLNCGCPIAEKDAVESNPILAQVICSEQEKDEQLKILILTTWQETVSMHTHLLAHASFIYFSTTPFRPKLCLKSLAGECTTSP